MKSIYKAERNWGDEFLIFVAPKYYTLKILRVIAGHKGGLQSHHKKFECGVILQGKMKIKTGPNPKVLDEKVIGKGDFFVFNPGLVHQEEAIEETFILEISSPHFNDRIRYDHKKNDENLLPTTNKDEVIEINYSSQIENIKKFGFEKINSDQGIIFSEILKGLDGF